MASCEQILDLILNNYSGLDRLRGLAHVAVTIDAAAQLNFLTIAHPRQYQTDLSHPCYSRSSTIVVSQVVAAMPASPNYL